MSWPESSEKAKIICSMPCSATTRSRSVAPPAPVRPRAAPAAPVEHRREIPPDQGGAGDRQALSLRSGCPPARRRSQGRTRDPVPTIGTTHAGRKQDPPHREEGNGVGSARIEVAQGIVRQSGEVHDRIKAGQTRQRPRPARLPWQKGGRSDRLRGRSLRRRACRSRRP
jgi:hypothetical protein